MAEDSTPGPPSGGYGNIFPLASPDGSDSHPAATVQGQTVYPDIFPKAASTTPSVLRVPHMLDRGWASLINMPPPDPQPSQTPITDVAKDVGGSVARGSVSALDTLLNPSELVMAPLRTAGAAAYDWLAPKMGLPQMTPEQRSDIIGQQGPVAQTAAAVPGPNPMSTPPATPIGQKLDMPIQSAIGAASLGPGGLLRRTALGAAGGAAGEATASVVPDEYKPFVGMVTNALVQGGGGAGGFYPGKSIDAADANVAVNSQKLTTPIPFRAPDLVPNSQLRSPSHVGDLNDSFRANVVQEMGENPSTSSATTTNKVTPAVLKATADRTGQVFDSIGQNNDIQPGPTFNLLTRLNQISRDVDNVFGVDAAQKAQMRQRIADVKSSINQQNGTIAGTDYLSLTKTGSPLDNLAGNSNSEVANIGMQAVDALHDAMNKSLFPQDQEALTNARYQYRVMKTAEPLVAADGTGNINPGDFAKRVTDQTNLFDRGTSNAAYTGGGTMGQLRDAGNLIAKGAPTKSLNPIPYMASPAGMLPYFLGRPVGEVAAAQMLPSLLYGAGGSVMRGAPYARQAFDNAMNPPSLVRRGVQGLLSGAVGP